MNLEECCKEKFLRKLTNRGSLASDLGETIVNKLSPSLVTTEHLQTLSSSTVGEFCLKGCSFLIVAIIADSTEDQRSSDFFSVAEFEIEGEHYAIVKVQPTVNHDVAELLTERELQIATLVALGRSNKQIAIHLHISEWTVSTHLRRIFLKLSVDSRAAMVYRCASLIQQVYSD